MSAADRLQEIIKTNCSSSGNMKIELRIGTRKPWGFEYGVSEDSYYSLYSFFFYQNEWVERVFDTYHVFDNKFGEDRIRINDDGFKFRDNFEVTKITFIDGFRADFQICEFLSPDISASNKRPHFRLNLFAKDVVRYSVDEVTLRFTDHLSIVFAKTVNLRSMKIIYSVKIVIHAFVREELPHTFILLPSGQQLLKFLAEMDSCLHFSNIGKSDGTSRGMDSKMYSDIVKESSKKLDSISPMAPKGWIQYSDMYRQPVQ